MSVLVIDASAAVYFASGRIGFEATGDRALVAPALMWSEALSAVHQALWRKEISRELADAARDRLLTAPVSRRWSADLRRKAWELAEELGWAKTYDAEYVALARQLNVPLLTRDARLRRGALRVVTAIGPDEL